MTSKKTKAVEIENKMIASRDFFDATSMQRFTKGGEVPAAVAKRSSDLVEESEEA